MKRLLNKIGSSWFVITCLVAIAAIIACNLWSLMNGHCAIHDFLHIPMIGWALILANVIAGMILYIVKHRTRKNSDESYCDDCLTDLRENWQYCPNCGHRLHV